MDLAQPHWVDWESTSEFNTDCDTVAVDLTEKLQTHITELQSLEAAQLLGVLVAEVVTQVVPPVVVMTPTLVDMDTTGAGPESTMGPGMPVQSKEMLLVLDADE